eukprot:g54785.t1
MTLLLLDSLLLLLLKGMSQTNCMPCKASVRRLQLTLKRVPDCSISATSRFATTTSCYVLFFEVSLVSLASLPSGGTLSGNSLSPPPPSSSFPCLSLFFLSLFKEKVI